jgi:hypothetical protein
MLIQGSPISINFPHGSVDNERFWYWRGVSGKKYIHSIYAADACPPLPGAIYVAVRRVGHLRTAITVGRFSPFWDGAFTEFTDMDADEIHVHLLARDNAAADAVLGDIKAAFGEASQTLSLAA